MRDGLKEDRFFRYLIGIVFSILLIINVKTVFHLLKIIWAVIFPLISGGMIAYLFHLIMTGIEERCFASRKGHFFEKWSTPLSLFLSMASVFLAMTLLLSVILPELWNACRALIEGFPELMGWTKGMFDRLRDRFPTNLFLIPEPDWDMLTEKLSYWLEQEMEELGVRAFGAVGGVVKSAVNTAVAWIFAVYLLLNKEQLKKQGKRLLAVSVKPPLLSRGEVVVRVVNETFQNFVIGQFLEAVILGSLCFVGMGVLGFPFCTMISSLIGVTALIPILGAYIGAGVGALLIGLESVTAAIEFLIFILILQQLENNLIYPRVVGNSIGLPGIWVFVSVIIGSGLAGVLGVLLGVPMAASLYKLIALWIEEKEEKMNSRLKEKEPRADP